MFFFVVFLFIFLLAAIIYIVFLLGLTKLADQIKQLTLVDLGKMSEFKYCTWFMLASNPRFINYLTNGKFHNDADLNGCVIPVLKKLRALYLSFFLICFLLVVSLISTALYRGLGS